MRSRCVAGRSRRSTADQRLLDSRGRGDWKTKDAWRALRILSEFVEGFDTLADLPPAVSVFGSARSKPDSPECQLAEELGAALARAGYAVITGGGPGVMEAANRGASEAGGLSVGLGIELPFEQGINEWVDLAIDFRYFFARKTMFVKYAQAFVRAARRVRHHGRAVRGAHPGADRQGHPVPGGADGRRLLAGPARLDARHDGGRGQDRAGRPGADLPHRRRRRRRSGTSWRPRPRSPPSRRRSARRPSPGPAPTSRPPPSRSRPRGALTDGGDLRLLRVLPYPRPALAGPGRRDRRGAGPARAHAGQRRRLRRHDGRGGRRRPGRRRRTRSA